MARILLHRTGLSTVEADFDPVLGILSGLWVNAARHRIRVSLSIAGVGVQNFSGDADRIERAHPVLPTVQYVRVPGLGGGPNVWALPADSTLSVMEN